jgi:hypothetical protein
MEDVNISIYRASVVREGSTPASPGFVVSDGQNPVDPSGSGQNHLPVTIAEAATGLSITESQVLGGAGTVGQYIRGDGSLADFPESSGGGSSVSYYLNGSVSQGTIGGVAYKELNKVPILGAGTDFTINADGYIASFLTDAGDPNLLEIPGGNWNFETYFSSSSSGGTPTFYVELYKYDGTTFTLIASSVSSPEFIAFGTTLTAYFSTLAVPTTTLALTDRLAVRYYVTHSGRTITLHTEDNHLCQIITTFTTGLTALNGLTAQVQNFAVGTSGTDFNIASATATHTFNLPTASATNRGALSSADWTTFNGKTSNLGTVTSVALTMPTAFSVSGSPITSSGTLAITATGTTAQYIRGDGSLATLPSGGGTVTSVGLSSATSGVTIGSSPVTTSGTITLAIATASGSQNGLLSSTDWTTFNGKQNALTNPVTGMGASGRVAYWNGTNSITSDADLLFDGSNLTVGGNITLANGANRFVRIGSVTNYNYDLQTTNEDFQIIEAGGSIATPRLTIKYPNGNVGINTTTPATTLEVNGVALFSGTSLVGNTKNGVYIYDTVIASLAGGNSRSLQIQAQTLSFFTGTTYTEKLKVFENGNVVISTSPSDNGAKLQVINGNGISFSSRSGASNLYTYAAFGRTSDELAIGIAGATDQFFTGSVAGDAVIKALGTNNNILLGYGTATALIINSSGNVGIGTISPSGKLTVKAGTNENVTIASLGGGDMRISALNDAASATVQLSIQGFPLIFRTTGGTEAMRIASSGSVGINNSSPMNSAWGTDASTKQLSIDASGYAVINLQGSTSRKYSMGVGDGSFYMCYDNTAGRHNLVVSSGGNVLINTTTSGSSKLRIVGLPTSSAGLSSGDVWSDSGTLKIA